MDIVELSDRFEYYCRINKDLAHDPGDKNNRSFLECDIDEVQAALKAGLKFPFCLLQTPEFDKKGNSDNAYEAFECSFLILKPYKDGERKFAIYRDCKAISDQIINYMIEDSDTIFEGGFVETSEGKVGPTVDKLIGWGVNFGLSQAYNGEPDPDKRRAV